MDNEAIEELFEPLGRVTIKRMFGGKGIYHHGVIFALELRDELMLKADAQTALLFAEAGARQWSYEGKTGKPVLMPYWSVPDEALDDPDVMGKWARLAYEAGVRTATK
ncbi:DNA transformation protein [Rhizobium sp. RU35A]|uniref:TfoX/Sxy family protein n=1 Tax=Rhizobium sp. RU35A TaxID=1907414 RepID=UPI00095443E1|nr:TfoX/Sxy family protein [Rhizobium sp. RU35A]SIR00510.1 DNA transformation protein [Rhizobium sp. RU35A]